MINTNKILNNFLGRDIVKDLNSRNKTVISERLKQLIAEYPNDYIVIANRFNSDFRISDNFTYRKDAIDVYNMFIDELDMDWKVGIYNLNKDDLKRFL